jgi:hypothetical protein
MYLLERVTGMGSTLSGRESIWLDQHGEIAMHCTIQRTGLRTININRQSPCCRETARMDHTPWCPNGRFHSSVTGNPDHGIGFSPIEDNHFNRPRHAVQLSVF